MDEYWQILHRPQITAALQMAALVFARLLPLTALTPVFGGDTMPKRLRTGLTVVLTITLLPSLLSSFHNPVPEITFICLLGKEALVGLSLAFFVLIVFQAIAAVGALIDLARGATLANVLDPLTQNQESILAAFFTQLGTVLFLSIGGMQLLLRAIAAGFVALRPQDILPARMIGPGATEQPIELVGNLFLVAFQLGAPAVIVLLLLDFALAIVNRISGKIQVFFLGMTAKGTLGLIIVLLAFGMTIDLLTQQFAGMLSALRIWTTK